MAYESTAGIGAGTGIGAWSLLVASTIAILARLLTKWSIEQALDLDDVFAVGALVFSHYRGKISDTHQR
jgi:hypothetical protein